MRILMLGWEFPPAITGGLGVACYGLARALDDLGHEVTFVLPRAADTAASPHIRLLTPQTLLNTSTAYALETDATDRPLPNTQVNDLAHVHEISFSRSDFARAIFHALPAAVGHSYASTSPYPHAVAPADRGPHAATPPVDSATKPSPTPHAEKASSEFVPTSQATTLPASPYAGDLANSTRDYARHVVALLRRMTPAEQRFDVIHAHDWLTFPAAIAAAALLDVPWIAHLHSTEFDRAGTSTHADRSIIEIEKQGLWAADRVITVSQRARETCAVRFGLDPQRIDVIYHGITPDAANPQLETPPLQQPQPEQPSTDPLVLFLGRVTSQKGPEYFIEAASKVLLKLPRARFVVAGAGDLENALVEQAKGLGIADRIFFTGFLRGPDVDRALRLADCFVMPSVSEPFGLVALEAAQRGVPVIISKQSGVAEVLHHVLKVDFWDTTDLADKILGVLRHPALAQSMAAHNTADVRLLSWSTAATRCVEAYHTIIRTHARSHPSGH
jgi:glycogen synthase